MKNELKRLDVVCDIALSNVDKKSKPNEKLVKLCNFTDVYYNWAIYSNTARTFMTATASKKNIELFSLKQGDVCITKDSETRDDIGMATYISEPLEDVVLGYHCALIRPHSELNGGYLNAYLHSYLGRKYFENQASGSGQRFSLSKESIGSIQIPLPSISTQTAIANLLSNIDKKISNNKLINDNLEKQAKLIYEFMMQEAKNGNITGKFTTSGDLTEVMTGKEDANFSEINGKYKFFTCSIEPLKCNKYVFDKSAILIAGNGDFNVKHYTGKFNAYQRTYVLSPLSEYYGLLYLACLYRINTFKSASSGSIVKFITKSDIENIPIFIPNDATFLIQLNKILSLQEKNSAETEKLISLRDWLLPMLMNGQATISD